MSDSNTNRINPSTIASQFLIGSQYTRSYNSILAIEIGEIQASILNQIQFWVEVNRSKNKHYHDGTYWMYNSLSNWEKEFPNYSKSSIRRAIRYLEENEYILIGNYNKVGWDNTKWYTVNEEKIESVMKDVLQMYNSTYGQNEHRVCSKRTGSMLKMNIAYGQNEHNNTINTSDNSSETPQNLSEKLCISQDENALYIRDVKKYVSSLRKHLPSGLSLYEKNRWLELLEFFFDKYQECWNKPHKVISLNTLSKFIENTTNYVDHLEGMIALHFDTDYREETDMSLSFFSEERILEILYFRYEGSEYQDRYEGEEEELPFQ